MAKLGEVFEKINNKCHPPFQYFVIFVLSSTLLTNGGVPLFLTFLTSTKGWQCRTNRCDPNQDLCKQTNLTDEDWFSPASRATDRFLKSYKIYCGYEGYFSMISSSYFFGFMIGILIGGKVMDWYGRHKCIWMGLFVFSLAVVLHASSKTDFRIFGVAHAFTGFMSGFIGAIYIYQSELTIIGFRNFGCQVHNEMYSIGMLYGAMLSYFIEDFVVICICLTIPALLFGMIIAVWVPESPFWLQVNNSEAEAKSVLAYIAKFNGIKYLREERIDPIERKNSDSAMSLFTFSNSTRRTTAIFLFSWLTASFCYWGLSFNVGDLIGNLYINQIIICAIDLVNRPINFYGVRFMKRVSFLRACNAGMAISAIICMIPYKKEIFPGFNIPKMSALAGRMIADLYFTTVYLYTSEVLPTSVRGSGLAICSSTARVGSIIAPFVILANKISPNINFTAILISSAVCFVCYRWMPETQGKIFPGTLSEMQDLVEGRTRTNIIAMNTTDRERLLDSSESEDETTMV